MTIEDGALDAGAIDLGRGPLPPAAPVPLTLTAKQIEWLVQLTVTADRYPMAPLGRHLNTATYTALLSALADASAGRRRARVRVRVALD